MLQTRRAALRCTRNLRTRPQQKRFESSHNSEPSHSSHAHDAHHPSGPVNEHFGRNFYLTLAAIPLGLAVYSFSHSSASQEPWLTRLINAYSNYKEDWTARNTLHTRMVEQAAFDRNLFQSSDGRGSGGFQLRYQEVFNTGSPFNVPTSSAVNLDGLIEHYKQKNREMAEKVERKTDMERLAAS